MLAKKMRIKEGTQIVALNAPSSYKKTLGALPKGVTITDKPGKKNNFVHLFVKNKKELDKQFLKVAKTLEADGLIWISYPKTTSGIQTDLTRDRGWDVLSAAKLRWLALISFDEKWSAFLLQNSAPQEQTKNSKEYHSNKEEWSDAKTKTVKIPADLESPLKKNKKARSFFDALSFTNKKEYVMWIVGAKRDETRSERIKKTIEKLIAGKKNPAEK
jgi:hypothetical protein